MPIGQGSIEPADAVKNAIKDGNILQTQPQSYAEEKYEVACAPAAAASRATTTSSSSSSSLRNTPWLIRLAVLWRAFKTRLLRFKNKIWHGIWKLPIVEFYLYLYRNNRRYVTRC
jgi:RecB family exonuclease